MKRAKAKPTTNGDDITARRVLRLEEQVEKLQAERSAPSTAALDAIEAMRTDSLGLFQKTWGTLNRVEASVNVLEEKIDGLNTRVRAVEKKLDLIDDRLGDHDDRFDAIDKQLSAIATDIAAILALLPPNKM